MKVPYYHHIYQNRFHLQAAHLTVLKIYINLKMMVLGERERSVLKKKNLSII